MGGGSLGSRTFLPPLTINDAMPRFRTFTLRSPRRSEMDAL
jgi:hypothetical protein